MPDAFMLCCFYYMACNGNIEEQGIAENFFYLSQNAMIVDVILDQLADYDLNLLRDAEESARLTWLKAHPEGEVEDAAFAWNCSYAEAMQQLRECEASGEWKITFRQQALYLKSYAPADARKLAESLSAAYTRRRDADLARYNMLCEMLCHAPCINAALEMYFTGKCMEPCGHCSSCLQEFPILPAAAPPPELPADAELPELSRLAQRKRFLLGLASPGLMARRLWSHQYYGMAIGAHWNNL